MILEKIVNRARILFLLSSMLLLTACSAIVADNSCGENNLSVEEMRKTFVVGKNLESALNKLGAEVIVVARSGQDLGDYGISYSHAGFMVKEKTGWNVYHLLNECPSSLGGLYQEGLGDFVVPAIINEKRLSIDSKRDQDSAPVAANLTFAYAIPPVKVQRALQSLLLNKSIRNSVFERNYSAVAHPYNLINQNSNGWLLELYALAEAQTEGVKLKDREDAHKWLQENGYQGTELPASILKQRLAAMVVGNISLKGHATGDRYQGKLLINSGDSVLHYIAGKNPLLNCERYVNSAESQAGDYCELSLLR